MSHIYSPLLEAGNLVTQYDVLYDDGDSERSLPFDRIKKVRNIKQKR
jgi:hypothetical protein